MGSVCAASRHRRGTKRCQEQGLENLDYHPVPNGHFGVAFIVLSTMMIYFAGETLRLSRKPRPASDLINAFLDQLKALQAKDQHEAVVRYHESLSRLLWVEGHLHARIQAGTLIANSAATVENRRVQAAVLIDDLGWTNVALKKYEAAKDNIIYGISVAMQVPDPYLVAKGYRHLAGLAVEQNNNIEALRNFDLARQNAADMSESSKKNEFLGGLAYGEAQLSLKENKLDLALKQVEESESLRREVGDDSRTVRVYALRGRIQEMQGDRLRARDSYIKGLHMAKRIGRVDEEIRNLEGLSRVDADLAASRRYSREADELKTRTPIPY